MPAKRPDCQTYLRNLIGLFEAQALAPFKLKIKKAKCKSRLSKNFSVPMAVRKRLFPLVIALMIAFGLAEIL